MLLLGATICVGSLASAQTFDEYVALRKQHGISHPAGVPSLETFVGERIVEVDGTVVGVVGGGASSVLILENPGSRELYIRAPKVPDWLRGNKTPARLIVSAKRTGEHSMLELELIGAAPRQRVIDLEAQIAASAAQRGTTASRTAAGQRNDRTVQPLTSFGAVADQQIWAVLPAYRDFIMQRNRRLSEAQATHIAKTILEFSLQYGVDARLIMAIVMVESGFDPNATSRAGAQGLGQLMPGTARGLGVSNSYDTEQNLNGTVRLIRGHIDNYTKQTGDMYEGLVLALAAYNAGSGNVRKHGGVPPFRETRNYIDKVISTYKQLIGQN